MDMTPAEEIAHRSVFRGPAGSSPGLNYGGWLIGQTLPKVVEQMGKDADPKDIVERPLSIVNAMLTKLASTK